MLKSQGIDAIPDSVQPYKVSICARRRPQLNTLRLNTQTGGPPVPWSTLCPVPQPRRVRYQQSSKNCADAVASTDQ